MATRFLPTVHKVAGILLLVLFFTPQSAIAAAIDWTEHSPPSIPPFQAQSFSAADADGDGDQDLLLGREDSGHGCAYFAGDGGAAWTNATAAELPGFSTFDLVALRDVDGNGLHEAFCVAKAPACGIHFSKKTNPALWGKSVILSPTVHYSSITFAKILGRTEETLVAAPPGGEAIDFFKYTPAGDGSWTRTVVATPSGCSVVSVAAADFDGDDEDEIAAADASGGLFIFDYAHLGWSEVRTNLPQGLGLTRLNVHDFDRDRAPDLLALTSANAIYVLLNRTGKAWEVILVDNKSVWNAISAGDATGDELLDILACRKEGVRLFTAKSATTWVADAIATPSAGMEFSNAGLARLDNDTWLDFVAIENGKELRLFYARDGAPPGGWSSFTPAGWITTVNPDCTVRVLDNVGLSSPTARYIYSVNGGGAWSAPLTAGVVLSADRKTATLTAPALPFPTSSRDQYFVRFSIDDLSGNAGLSPVYAVRIDNVPPGNPSLIYTFRHRPSEWGDWSHLNQIRFSWPAGVDEHSRIAGYSCAIDHSAATPADGTIDYDDDERDVTTAALADSSAWYIHLRAVDNAGNLSTGTMHAGPFYIDTHAPDPPTVRIGGLGSGSWPAWWLGHQTICVYRGDDGVSEAVGVRTLVTRNPVSDPSRSVQHDGWRHEISTEGLDTSQAWYVHAVTVDRAGNLSPVVHEGPLRIDMLNPGGFFTVSPETVAGDRIRVEASRITDSGESGVRRWMLYYRIEGTTDWTEWATYDNDAPEQTVTFIPPDRFQGYELSARFEDNAGRISNHTYPRSTRFAGSRVVQVEVEYAALSGDPAFEPRGGVKIYKNDDFIGTTDAAGRIVVPAVVLGDRITALCRVRTRSSTRRDREELGGDPWAYRVYITNVNVGDDGTLSGHIVETAEGTINLTLRRRNALIGFHLVASLNWNADGVYLTNLRQRWIDASNYLYNASDGQMFIELAEIYENSAKFDTGGDARVYFRDLRENAAVNGLYSRYSWNNIELDYRSGGRVIIHELGHYGMGLYDEYITHRSDWLAEDAWCTLNRLNTTSPYAADTTLSACVMDNQGDATNFCDDLAANPHNHDTAQHRWHHEPCWASIQQKFNDDHHFPSWQEWYIRRPTGRDEHMPGPAGIPCTDWMRVHTADVPGGAGYEWTFQFQNSFGDPYAGDEVDLIRHDGTVLPMGGTDRDGRIFLYNIFHDNRVCIHELQEGWDTAIDHYVDLPDTRDDVSNPVILSAPDTGRPVTLSVVRLADGATTLPATLDLRPGSTITQLCVLLTPPEPFSEPPIMTLWPDDQQGLVICQPLAWNSAADCYQSTVTLPAADHPSGRVSIRTVDWTGGVADVGSRYHFIPVENPSEPFQWGPSGGDVVIFASPEAFTSGTILMLSDAGAESTEQLRFVKGPFRIAANDGLAPAAPAGLMLTCSDEDLLPVDTSDIAIYRWDSSSAQWQRRNSSFIASHGEVSTQLDRFGIYAVAAPPRRSGIGAATGLYR